MTTEQRVTQLERRYRVMQALTTVSLLVLAGIALMGQAARPAPPRVIEAQRFVLKDAAGKTLGLWGDFGGATGFGLQTRDGRMPFLLMVDKDGNPAAALSGADGTTLQLSSSPGATGLVLRDAKDKKRGSIGLDQNGRVLFVEYDDNERPRARQ